MACLSSARLRRVSIRSLSAKENIGCISTINQKISGSLVFIFRCNVARKERKNRGNRESSFTRNYHPFKETANSLSSTGWISRRLNCRRAFGATPAVPNPGTCRDQRSFDGQCLPLPQPVRGMPLRQSHWNEGNRSPSQ